MAQDNKQLVIQIILLILVAGFAFGLGYLIRGKGEITPIIIENKS